MSFCECTIGKNSTSLLYKLLVTLHKLHGTKECADGAQAKDIIEMMRCNYPNEIGTGDEIIAILNEAVRKHYIFKDGRQYVLLPQIASLHCSPDTVTRQYMIEVLRAYPPSWYRGDDEQCRMSPSCSSRVVGRRQAQHNCGEGSSRQRGRRTSRQCGRPNSRQRGRRQACRDDDSDENDSNCSCGSD